MCRKNCKDSALDMKEKSKELFDKEIIRRQITRGKYGAIFTPSSFPSLTANYATKLLSTFEKPLKASLVALAKKTHLTEGEIPKYLWQ